MRSRGVSGLPEPGRSGPAWAAVLRAALQIIILLAAGSTLAQTVDGAEATEEAGEAVLQIRHEDWLKQAELLLSDAERTAFLSLEKDYQRDAFMRRFWAARDPYPETSRNEFKDRWSDRLAEVERRYGDVEDDRGRMLLLNGPAETEERVTCQTLLRPILVWSYAGTDRIRTSFSLVFYSRSGSLQGPYRLWYPSEGLTPLLNSLASIGQVEDLIQTIGSECIRSDTILAGVRDAADWGRIADQIDVVPRPGDEWLQTFFSYSTDLPEGATTFQAELELAFPGRTQNRTVVQGLVWVPVGGAPGDDGVGENRAYVLDGEILRRGELFEHFRYRFPISGATGERLPLVFQRPLRPGTYRMVLKVEDVAGGSYYREELDLEVPSVVRRAPAQTASASPAEELEDPEAPAGEASTRLLGEANRTLVEGDASIKLLAPPARLMTGISRFEAVVRGDEVARVRFELDGKPVLTKSREPFSVELNLGDAPRLHTVRAVALGRDGTTLAADQIAINAGPHRFAIRLIDPEPGKVYRRSLRANASVEVPEGERLDRVELYLNEDLVATLHQPPFAHPILLPPDLGVTFVRAVAYLSDGNFTEDAVIVNAPDFTDQTKVQLVELYTTAVDRRGRPVADLGIEDFQVEEDGVPQALQRCELVREQPIYAGILLDTSASMVDELKEAVAGALRFFETVLRPKDRAAVMTFSERPRLEVRFTNDIEVLAGGLTDLTAVGETALYDSLIEGLYYFSGIKGKRALILLSDGADVDSRYSYEQVIEYARRTGVAIYAIGLKLAGRNTEIRVKLQRLANETGGRAFFIDSGSELKRVYDLIEEELRSQYRLVYQSTNTSADDTFRLIELEVARPGLEATTVRGYYP